MKRAVLIIALVVIGLSCLVDRRSGDFDCESDTDCADFDDERVCTNKVCLPVTCPPVCDDCDSGKICNIDCTGMNECRQGVSCPAGYNCKFTCDADCTPVTCTSALSCTVTCETGADCGPLICGAASPCTCTASGGVCL